MDGNMMGHEIFKLDVLPGHCAVEVEMVIEENEVAVKVARFRAKKLSDDNARVTLAASEWSGWFPADPDNLPIFLKWSAFTWPAQHTQWPAQHTHARKPRRPDPWLTAVSVLLAGVFILAVALLVAGIAQ